MSKNIAISDLSLFVAESINRSQNSRFTLNKINRIELKKGKKSFELPAEVSTNINQWKPNNTSRIVYCMVIHCTIISYVQMSIRPFSANRLIMCEIKLKTCDWLKIESIKNYSKIKIVPIEFLEKNIKICSECAIRNRKCIHVQANAHL